MDDATVPTPPAPRQPRRVDVEALIAFTGVASMATAIIVDPVALLVTAAAVAAQIVWGWTR